MPKVSIIIPAFNNSKFLPETLDSVMCQSFRDWECIVVDDGSTDDTSSVVKKYTLIDNRFKYFYQNNNGVSSARNFGIAKSEGKYILPLDSDDKISPWYIEEAIDYLQKNQTTKVVYCKAEFMGERKGDFFLPKYNYELMLLENIIFCSAIFSRENFYKTKGYDETLKVGLEDWDFWLSFLGKNDVVYQIPKIHFFYRIKNNSLNYKINHNKIKFLITRNKIFHKHKNLYSPRKSIQYKIHTFILISRLIRFGLWSFIKKFFS